MHLSVLSIQDFLLENTKEWKEKQIASWNNTKLMCIRAWIYMHAHTHTHRSTYVCSYINCCASQTHAKNSLCLTLLPPEVLPCIHSTLQL